MRCWRRLFGNEMSISLVALLCAARLARRAGASNEHQTHLAHKKELPPRTLQQDHAWGPTVLLGGGQFPMSEVTLYHTSLQRRTE